VHFAGQPVDPRDVGRQLGHRPVQVASKRAREILADDRHVVKVISVVGDRRR